ncbi:hypothetical protein D3C80_940680 [compost metagenome]
MIITQQAMGRPPTIASADTTAFLQDAEKGMAQEGLSIGQQTVPLGSGYLGKGVQRLDRHRYSLACRADEKKPCRRQGFKGGFTNEA